MVLPFSADAVHGEDLVVGLDGGGAAGGRGLAPLVAREAAIGQQGEFAGLLENAAGLAGIEMDLGRGDAGGRELADGEGFGANLLAVLEDGEGALIDYGGGGGFALGRFFAREQSRDEQE